MSKFYTGVGSRRTPDDIRVHMVKFAQMLAFKGYILRSGGADRADTYFAEGACGKSHIYLPWPGFNCVNHCQMDHASVDAYRIASTIHPAWGKLKHSVRALHARNVHQVLGDNLDTPSEFLICWTPDGKPSGGTATAIRLAMQHEVPVFNLRLIGMIDETRAMIEALPYA